MLVGGIVAEDKLKVRLTHSLARTLHAHCTHSLAHSFAADYAKDRAVFLALSS